MTQEEKAKAYDAAIKYAHYLINERCKEGTGSSFHRTDLNKMFPELKESEDERIRKNIIATIHLYYGEPLEDEAKEMIAWLEKQGEQNLANSAKTCKDEQNAVVVTPKFKVGDWVVYYRNDSSMEILYVYDIRDGRYYFNDNIHFSWSVKECDEKCHLWTIQDAEAGDVLATEPIEGYHSPFVAIYKKQNEEDFTSYCFIGFDGKFYKGEFSHSTVEIHPATKEQHDTLEKTMADAGYTFDFEKKELKKIEQKPAESINDVYPETLDKAIDLYYYSYGNGNGYFENLSFEKFKDIAKTFVRDYSKQKPAWSEEDISKIDRLIMYFKGKDNKEFTEWFTLLKDRVQPQLKQEWKQENTGDLTDFENAMMHIGGSFFGQHQGLDPNDTSVVKEQAKLLLELIPSKEWSEEDEKKLRGICNYISCSDSPEGFEEWIDWLKSLRPQNTWKPSEEQMAVLNEVINYAANSELQHWSNFIYTLLKSLREQLKKLE